MGRGAGGQGVAGRDGGEGRAARLQGARRQAALAPGAGAGLRAIRVRLQPGARRRPTTHGWPTPGDYASTAMRVGGRSALPSLSNFLIGPQPGINLRRAGTWNQQWTKLARRRALQNASCMEVHRAWHEMHLGDVRVSVPGVLA